MFVAIYLQRFSLIPAAIILFLTAFFISLIITAIAKRIALRLGFMDAPGERKVHTIATPRNGGIGIFWGFALPLLLDARARAEASGDPVTLARADALLPGGHFRPG